jgi:hypothetical protein
MISSAAAMPSPTLNYATPLTRPRALTLEERAEGFALTLPLPPKWLMLGSTILMLSFSGLLTAWAVYMTWRMYELWLEDIPIRLSRLVWTVWKYPAFLGLSGIYFFLDERRWGHVPRMLSVEGGRLRWQRRRFWGVRTDEWPLEQVREVRLKPVRSLFGAKTVADLTIRFHNSRWPLRLRLSSRDAELPRRVAALLDRAVGTPVER